MDDIFDNLANDLLMVHGDLHLERNRDRSVNWIRSRNFIGDSNLLWDGLRNWAVNSAKNGERDRHIHRLIYRIRTGHFVGHVYSFLDSEWARNINRSVHGDENSLLNRNRIWARNINHFFVRGTDDLRE
jgi:hypothetical protein